MEAQVNALVQRVIRPHVKGLSRIADSAPDRFSFIRLDKNERLLEFPESFMADYRRRLTSESLTGYPELQGVYERLADWLGVSSAQLYLASGSDLAIRAVYEACIEPGDNVVLHLPCYAMYHVYAELYGAVARAVPVTRDAWRADVDEMMARVDEKTKFVALELPNGFVGTLPERHVIEECARVLYRKGVMLVLDEAYAYIESNCFSHAALIREFPNVVVVQTFSKAHGLAGARLGYLAGHQAMVEQISKTRPVHEITGPTAVAVSCLLDHPELLIAYQQEVTASKGLLRDGLPQLGIPMRDTHANFVLLHVPDQGRTADLVRKLRERQILIRRPFKEDFLAGWSRVCVGTCDQTRGLLTALHELVGESDHG